MTVHATMTGADLHEPKGVAAATDKQVATASSGTVLWTSALEPASLTLSTTVDEVLSFGAGSFAGGTADLAEINSSGLFGYQFEAAADESIYGSVSVPEGYKDGEDLTIRIKWAPASTNTGNVDWQLTYQVADAAGVIAAGNVTTVSVQDAGDGVAYAVQEVDLATVTGTSIESGDVILFTLTRDADDAVNDTFTGEAWLLAFEIVVPREAIGS